jgi:hypothetical protein
VYSVTSGRYDNTATGEYLVMAAGKATKVTVDYFSIGGGSVCEAEASNLWYDRRRGKQRGERRALLRTWWERKHR